MGLGIAAALAVRAGLPAILEVLARLGPAELASVCLLQLGATVLCGAGWRVFARNSSLLACTAARSIRDGTSSVLAIVPGLGEIAGVRALALFGIPGRVAAATAIVDLGAELLSQCVFTALGIVALLVVLGDAEVGRWLAFLVGAVVPAFGLSLLIGTRTGRALVARLLARLAGFGGPLAAGFGSEVAHDVASAAADGKRVAASTLIHLAAWFLGAAQIWAAAEALDHPLSPAASLALASLVHAARGIFFVVPWGAGIQEAGFVVAGALLGMDEPAALALSLVMRVRDLVLGLPSLLVWGIAETRAAWIRGREAAGPPVTAE